MLREKCHLDARGSLQQSHPRPAEPELTIGTDEIARDADTKRLAHLPHSQRTEIPPSTWKWEPVANADSSEARKTAIPAMSCGVPTRPIGCSATSLARTSGSSSSGFVRVVSIVPGTMPLTRMPCGA